MQIFVSVFIFNEGYLSGGLTLEGFIFVMGIQLPVSLKACQMIQANLGDQDQDILKPFQIVSLRNGL